MCKYKSYISKDSIALAIESLFTMFLPIVAKSIVPLEDDVRSFGPNNRTVIVMILITLCIILLVYTLLVVCFLEILYNIRYLLSKLRDLYLVFLIVMDIYLLIEQTKNNNK